MLRRIPIRIKVAAALALPLAGLLVAAAYRGVRDDVDVRQRDAPDRPGRCVGRPRRAHRRPPGRAEPRAPRHARPRRRAHARGGRHARPPASAPTPRPPPSTTRSRASSDRLREDYADALDSLVDLPALRRQADAAAATPGPAATARRPTPCSPGTPASCRTLFASHDRFSLEVDRSRDPPGRRPRPLRLPRHRRRRAAGRAPDLRRHRTGRRRPAREAAEIASLRRDVERNNTRGAGRGVGAVRRRGRGRWSPTRGSSALPGAGRPGRRRGPVRRSAVAPGRDAARPRGRLPDVP